MRSQCCFVKLLVRSKVWRDAMTWVRAGVQSSRAFGQATRRHDPSTKLEDDANVTVLLCCRLLDCVSAALVSSAELSVGFAWQAANGELDEALEARAHLVKRIDILRADFSQLFRVLRSLSNPC